MFDTIILKSLTTTNPGGHNMKLKAAITGGANPALFEAFGSSEFARRFLLEVAEGKLGASDTLNRPAEYYVQFPDQTVPVEDGFFGVEVRLTGVSRGGREAKMFHEALKILDQIVRETARDALSGREAVQVFVVIMLDGDVETSPGSGIYSNTLESEADMVHGGPAASQLNQVDAERQG